METLSRFLDFANIIIRRHSGFGYDYESAPMVYLEGEETPEPEGLREQRQYITNLYQITNLREENHIYRQNLTFLTQILASRVSRNLYPSLERQIEKTVRAQMPEVRERTVREFSTEIRSLMREGGFRQIEVLRERLLPAQTDENEDKKEQLILFRKLENIYNSSIYATADYQYYRRDIHQHFYGDTKGREGRPAVPMERAVVPPEYMTASTGRMPVLPGQAAVPQGDSAFLPENMAVPQGTSYELVWEQSVRTEGPEPAQMDYLEEPAPMGEPGTSQNTPQLSLELERRLRQEDAAQDAQASPRGNELYSEPAVRNGQGSPLPYTAQEGRTGILERALQEARVQLQNIEYWKRYTPSERRDALRLDYLEEGARTPEQAEQEESTRRGAESGKREETIRRETESRKSEEDTRREAESRRREEASRQEAENRRQKEAAHQEEETKRRKEAARREAENGDSREAARRETARQEEEAARFERTAGQRQADTGREWTAGQRQADTGRERTAGQIQTDADREQAAGQVQEDVVRDSGEVREGESLRLLWDEIVQRSRDFIRDVEARADGKMFRPKTESMRETAPVRMRVRMENGVPLVYLEAEEPVPEHTGTNRAEAVPQAIRDAMQRSQGRVGIGEAGSSEPAGSSESSGRTAQAVGDFTPAAALIQPPLRPLVLRQEAAGTAQRAQGDNILPPAAVLTAQPFLFPLFSGQEPSGQETAGTMPTGSVLQPTGSARADSVPLSAGSGQVYPVDLEYAPDEAERIRREILETVLSSRQGTGSSGAPASAGQGRGSSGAPASVGQGTGASGFPVPENRESSKTQVRNAEELVQRVDASFRDRPLPDTAARTVAVQQVRRVLERYAEGSISAQEARTALDTALRAYQSRGGAAHGPGPYRTAGRPQRARMEAAQAFRGEPASILYAEEPVPEGDRGETRRLKKEVEEIVTELRTEREKTVIRQEKLVERQQEIVREVISSQPSLLTEGKSGMQLAQQIERTMDARLDESVGRIVNQVYRRLEDRLKTERERRGLR